MQRIEVITGKERRRFWSEAEKLRIVAEADMPGVTQTEVARQNEVHPNQIYLWRKAFQRQRQENSDHDKAFFPVEIVSEKKTETEEQTQTAPIEVILNNGRMIRIGTGFDEETLKRVLTVLEDT